MHMTIPLKVLQAGLKTLAPAMKARSPLPILKHVLIQDRTLSATDLDLRIEHTLSEATMHMDHEPGGCTVDYKTLTDWVSLAKGDITFKLQQDQLHVTSGKSKTTLPTLPAEEFPSYHFEDGGRYEFPDGTLQQVLRKVDFARAQQEETRAVMTGLLFSFGPDGLTLCGCDGRRLAYQTLPGNYEKREAVLSGIDVILGLPADISLTITNGAWLAQSGDTKIGGRIMEGSFPDWRKVSTFDTPTLATLNRTELVEALRRVLLFCQDKHSPHLVRMDFAGGILRITGETAGTGSGVEEIGTPGFPGELTIAFNGKYLLEGLTCVDTPTIEWGFQDAGRASRIRVGEWQYVTMPVKIREAAYA